MLGFMRKHSGSWVIKIFLFLLILSFATWGVEGWIGGWGSRKPALTVGNIDISKELLNREFTKRLKQVNRKSIDRAVLLDKVIQIFITETLLSLASEDLGLRVSDAFVREAIKKDPQFFDDTDQFNRGLFNLALQYYGMNEEAFVGYTKNKVKYGLIQNAIATQINPPRLMAEAFHRYEMETRAVDIIRIKHSQMKRVTQPKLEELKEIYETQQERFMMPEYRTFSIIQVTQDHVKNEDDPSEAMYRLSTELQDTLAGGVSFEEAAKIHGLKNTKITSIDRQGKNKQGQKVTHPVLTSALIKTVFSLEEGDMRPMDLPDGGYQMLAVESVMPATPYPLEAVKNKVIATWKQQNQDKMAFEKAEKILSSIKKGQAMSKVAVQYGVQKQSLHIKRFSKDPFLLQIGSRLFAAPKGQAISMGVRDGYVIGLVKDILTLYPEHFESGAKKSLPILKAYLERSLLESYTQHLRKKYGVQVNQDVIKQAFSFGDDGR